MKGNCEKCSGAKAQLRSRRDVRGPIDKKETGELSTPASVGNNESPWLSRTTSPYFSANTVTSLFFTALHSVAVIDKAEKEEK